MSRDQLCFTLTMLTTNNQPNCIFPRERCDFSDDASCFQLSAKSDVHSGSEVRYGLTNHWQFIGLSKPVGQFETLFCLAAVVSERPYKVSVSAGVCFRSRRHYNYLTTLVQLGFLTDLRCLCRDQPREALWFTQRSVSDCVTNYYLLAKRRQWHEHRRWQ